MLLIVLIFNTRNIVITIIMVINSKTNGLYLLIDGIDERVSLTSTKYGICFKDNSVIITSLVFHNYNIT